MRHTLATLLRRLADRIERFPMNDKGEVIEPMFSRGMGVSEEWWQSYAERVEQQRSEQARMMLERIRQSRNDDPGSENFTP